MRPVVLVVATTFEGTRAALAAAVPLARGEGAGLAVVVPRIVSCGAELDMEPASVEPLTRRYRQIARALGAEAEVDVCSSVGMTELVARICAAQSRVVVGGPAGRWLTSPEERFAHRLASAGCQVVFAASGGPTTQRRSAA